VNVFQIHQHGLVKLSAILWPGLQKGKPLVDPRYADIERIFKDQDGY